MRMGRIASIALIATSLLGTGALAADTVSVRLVRASNSDTTIDHSLQDVAPALQKSLVFKSYRQVAVQKLTLPAQGQSASLGVYRITATGSRDKLLIGIHQGRKALVNTSVSLKRGKPVILGGFPDKSGAKMIFVFVLK